MSYLKLAAPILPFPWCHLFTVAGVAHRFHSICGKNVTLEEEGTRAVRAAGYAHGLVFSTKELKTEEVFEVGCEDVTKEASRPFTTGPDCFLLPCPQLVPANIFSYR